MRPVGSGSLARRLGLVDATVIGVGSMVGAGIFVVFGPAAKAAGTGLLIGLVVAAGIAFCNAVSSAQLAAVHPVSGGTYIYGRLRLGDWWGFVAGWGFLIGKTASCAAVALTFASYVLPEPRWGRHLLAVAAVAALTALNYQAVTGTTTDRVGRLGPDGAGDVLGVLQAAGLLFFAFAGSARIATMGEEVRDPERVIPRATSALAITITCYLVVGVSALMAAGPQRLAASSTPLLAAAEAAGAGGVAPVVRVGASVASLGALLALMTGVGRTALAMARHGDLPTWLGAVHPRHRVPHHAQLVVGRIVIVLTLTTDLRGCLVLVVTLPPPAVLTGLGVLAVGLTGRRLALHRHILRGHLR